MESDGEWPIDKLPEEVLVEIFSLLDSKDLHELAKVRSDWKKLINENERTRKNLSLLLTIWDCPTIEKASVFRYNKILICGGWIDASEAMRKFSNDLRYLSLTDCHLSFNQTLVDAFKSLGKLEFLKMRDVLSDSSFNEIQAHKLDNLKTVIITNSSWKVLKFIGLSQITRLKINGPLKRTLKEVDCLIEFFCAQTKLEELVLLNISLLDVKIESRVFEKMIFPLKRLTLGNFKGGEANTLSFLKRFSNTLEELELGGHSASVVASPSYAVIFETLRMLKSLKFDAQYLPQNVNFYKTLPTLGSVKKLVIWFGGDQHRKCVHGVIAHLPNVETLIFRGQMTGNELMTFVSNNLVKLKSLGIDELAGNAFRDVRMPESLRKFDLGGFREASDEDWTEMLNAMPNVKQFTIWRSSELNSAKFDAMTRSWPKLRVLNLGYGFVPEAQLFNDLLAHCPNITTVRVSGCEADHPSFKDFKKPGLRLIAREKLGFEFLEDEKDPTLLNY